MKIKFILSVCLFWALAFQLSAIHSKPAASEAKPISTLDIMKQQQQALQIKAVEVGLSKEEIKLQKKLDKKLVKAEKRAARGKAYRERSWIVAVVLSFCFGILAIDRFYLGYTGWGLLKLFTLGGLGVWAIIDFILILVRGLNPKNGEYID